MKSQSSDFEKKQYKDQSGKLEEMQKQLHKNMDYIDGLEMENLTLKDQLETEKQKMDGQLQEVKTMYENLNKRYVVRMEELEKLEEQLVIKDEMAKQYEEVNIDLKERVLLMNEKMEELGDNKSQYDESFAQERSMCSQKGGKLKEL